MKFKLQRRQEVSQIDNTAFPLKLREGKGGWVIMAESNSFDTLFSIYKGLCPQDQFRIIKVEARV